MNALVPSPSATADDFGSGCGFAARASATQFVRNPASGAQQFDVELQRGIRRDDTTRAARAIAQAGGNDQRALAAFLHALHAFVPTLDHHAAAKREDKGLITVAAGVELGSLLAVLVQPAGVMHDHVVAGAGFGAGADDGVFELQAGSGGGERHGGSS